MSNLYKQWFVASETKESRVINSNAVMAAKIEEAKKLREEELQRENLLKETTQHADSDGKEPAEFVQGLVASQVSLFTEEDATNLKEQTQKQTEEMLAQAKEEADAILAEAKAQAEQYKKQAKEEGFQAGFTEGSAKAKEEFDKQKEAFENEKEEARKEYKQKMDALEPALLDVMLQVFEKVFRIRFSDKKEILSYLVQNAISNASGCKEFLIRCSEADYEELLPEFQKMKEELGAGIQIEVLKDASYESGKCVIETDAGLFDTSLDVCLEDLKKDLKSLCLT